MKLLAPAVIILGFSFLLYNTREVWPKDVYDSALSQDTISTLEKRIRDGHISAREASNELARKLFSGEAVKKRGYSSPADVLSRSIISMDID